MDWASRPSTSKGWGGGRVNSAHNNRGAAREDRKVENDFLTARRLRESDLKQSV